MNVTALALPEVRLLVPERREDARGWVSATWERSRLAAAGIEADFLQDNQVNSRRAGTVRGLHFQAAPFAQAKLMRVLRGAAYDVAVDIRPGSPTFGRWAGARLSAEGGEQLYSPRGFARGCVTLADDSELLLKVDRPHAPQHQGAIAWDDPDLRIDWGLDPSQATLSERDRSAPRLRDLPPVAF